MLAFFDKPLDIFIHALDPPVLPAAIASLSWNFLLNRLDLLACAGCRERLRHPACASESSNSFTDAPARTGDKRDFAFEAFHGLEQIKANYQCTVGVSFCGGGCATDEP